MRAMYACFAALFVGAAAHCSLISPMPRNAVDRDLPAWRGGKFGPSSSGSNACARVAPATRTCWGCDCHNGTHLCEVGQSCVWFSDGCTIGCDTCDGGAANPNTRDRCKSGMRPTNNDPRFRTANRWVEAMSAADVYQHNPWRSPGNAPVYDACGAAGGGPYTWNVTHTQLAYVDTPFARQGALGSALPRNPTGVVWRAGETVEAKWSVRANHGGGYQYRLCPASEPLKEQCFQRHPIPFANRTWLEFRNGSRLEIPGTYLSSGTTPANSTWAMNPLPWAKTFAPPCLGTDPRANATDPRDNALCGGVFPFGVNIVDALAVPADTPPGEYVLGLRYDCEITAQVWSQCADITIVAP